MLLAAYGNDDLCVLFCHGEAYLAVWKNQNTIPIRARSSVLYVLLAQTAVTLIDYVLPALQLCSLNQLKRHAL